MTISTMMLLISFFLQWLSDTFIIYILDLLLICKQTRGSFAFNIYYFQTFSLFSPWFVINQLQVRKPRGRGQPVEEQYDIQSHSIAIKSICCFWRWVIKILCYLFSLYVWLMFSVFGRYIFSSAFMSSQIYQLK